MGCALGAWMALTGCTTLVEVELPEATPQGVMEATVRLGEPPLVLLTTTQGYFDAVDASSLTSLFVGGAEVVMTVDGEEDMAPLYLHLLAPLGTVVVFGMPGWGLMVQRTTLAMKERCRTILNAFEVK